MYTQVRGLSIPKIHFREKIFSVMNTTAAKLPCRFTKAPPAMTTGVLAAVNRHVSTLFYLDPPM
jgi:hypothetical protein